MTDAPEHSSPSPPLVLEERSYEGHVNWSNLSVMKNHKSNTTDMPSQNKNLFLALELGKTKWSLCFGDGKRIRRRNIVENKPTELLREIELCKQKFGLEPQTPVHSLYEAGRDGFWIHRFLRLNGINNLVVDSASIETNRRAKRTKTDRIDARKLLQLLMRIVLLGERKVCAVVRVPTEEQEVAMRVHRERERLVTEQTAHRNRLGSLLQLHGIEVDNLNGQVDFTTQVDWQGRPLAPVVVQELQREQQRLQMVREQLAQILSHQKQQINEAAMPATVLAAKLMGLCGIGVQTSWLLSHEFFWRDFNNRKQVGACAGLTGSPYDSGQSQKEQGISKAGNRRVRALSIEMAWNWLRYQPQSQLSQWFVRRFGAGTSRQRRVGIVALARKLLVALWKYIKADLLPQDAQLKLQSA